MARSKNIKKFVVNPYSITYEAIQNDLRYMVAQDQTTFTDFFNDASGSTVIDTAAALGAFFAYHIIAHRKEFSLEQATSYQSLISNAYDKGYNVSRGSNIKLVLTVTPNTTGSISAWTTIGSIQEYDVVLLEDVTFITGVQTEIKVTIGNRKSEGISITTNNPTLFRFTNDDITDDLRLFLNNQQIDYTTDIVDLLNDKYLVQTNSWGSINVFYLNTGSLKYTVGSTLAVDYIARNSLSISDLSETEFYLNQFKVTDMGLLDDRVSKESKDSIRTNALLHAETTGIVKARADFKKVIQSKDLSISSISDYEIQPGRIGIIIAKKDHTPLNDTDKIKYNELVNSCSASGVANLYYTDAHRYDIPLKVSLTPLDSVTTPRNLVTDVENLVSEYEYKISDSVDFKDIESYIEQELEGVKIARVEIDSNKWENKNYRLSDTCISSNFDGKTYYVAQVDYKTGETEPNWEVKEDGFVVDNNILWKEYLGNSDGISFWRSNVVVPLGKLVANYFVNDKGEVKGDKVWECVGYVARTGEEEPDWALNEEVISDNNIYWYKTEPNNDAKIWSKNTLKQIGDTIKKVIATKEDETYIDNAAFKYSSEIFGDMYTESEMDLGSIVYSDRDLKKVYGAVKNIDKTRKTVSIQRPTDITGDYTKVGNKYSYFIASLGLRIYTTQPLAENVNCYNNFETMDDSTLIGIVKSIDTAKSQVTITLVDASDTTSNYSDRISYFIYYCANLGGAIYTKSEITYNVICYSDYDFELSSSLGYVKEITPTTITVSMEKPIYQGYYTDLTKFEYVGATTGTFYTKSTLEKGVECFQDGGFKTSIGIAQKVNKALKIVHIESDETYQEYYYRVGDYSMPTGDKEPNWEKRISSGLIQDGNQLWWRESEYPIKFINLGNDTYAKFDTTVTMESV